MYNQYIASIKENECMDCGSTNIVYNTDDNGRKTKQCKNCGKEYYVSYEVPNMRKFENVKTKVLLRLLHENRLGEEFDESYYEELKAELATREHVPNKIESKKIRQEKQKAKQNR